MTVTAKTSFPRKVKEVENFWIPMADGVKLAARMWIPKDAEKSPVPAVIEYLPYRKRDGTIVRDALTHPYFAGHGYAAIRIDMRGNGDSEGLMADEYTKQEQDDAVEAIAWIARGYALLAIVPAVPITPTGPPPVAATAARAPGSITPITGTGDCSRSTVSACAVLVLHATTTSLTPCPTSQCRISRL